MIKYSDSPRCEPNTPLLRDVFFVVFGDKKVSRIPESYVRICWSWPVQASNSHMTTRVFSVTEYKKCTQTSKIIPYLWFRYALLVPTVARVHFLNLKPLVCILISMGSTWDIGTKYRYVIPQDFGSQTCTLTIPTTCTIDTLTKVVGRIKQWHDCPANNGVLARQLKNWGATAKIQTQLTLHP